MSSESLQPKRLCTSVSEPDTASDSQETRPDFDSLPDETLLHIFTYVPPDKIVGALSHVCQRWHTLHLEPSLYRSLTFTEEIPRSCDAVQLLCLASQLRRLEMTDRQDTDLILRHTGANHPRLETLVIHNCNGNAEDHNVSEIHLWNVIHYCIELRHLCITETHCESSVVFKEIGLRLPHLRIIDLECFYETFSIEALQNITDNCLGVEEIRIFSVSMQIPEDNMISFCNKFQSTLRKVEFTECATWTDISVAALSNCQKITKLRLDSLGNVTDQGIMVLGDMPNLVDLYISEASHVTTSAMIRLMKKPNMQRLERLVTESNNVDDAVLRAVSSLPRLQALFLDAGGITDAGITIIGAMPRLTSLSLWSAERITTQGWINLFSQTSLAGIKHLQLEGCESVDDAVACFIAGNLPGLNHLNLYLCSSNITQQGSTQAQQLLPEHCNFVGQW